MPAGGARQGPAEGGQGAGRCPRQAAGRRRRDRASRCLRGGDAPRRPPRRRLDRRRAPRGAADRQRGARRPARAGAPAMARGGRPRARGGRPRDRRRPGGRGAGLKAREVVGLDPAAALAENAARIVLVRIDEMRVLAAAARRRDASRAQHDLRIAAKRLRYVLEVVGTCFDAPAEVARRRARELQDLLGGIHDCDVLLPRVARHREALRLADAKAVRERAGAASDLDPGLAAGAPHRTSYRGLDVLEVYLRARRALLFDRFLERWREIEAGGILSDLEDASRRALRRSTVEA
ncbi:MAG: CHAD domain-containing protein [Thermoleophilia bacterium]|nr:CHAD domain-containing protein [Thermoleophilia bacterium]